MKARNLCKGKLNEQKKNGLKKQKIKKIKLMDSMHHE